MSASENSAPHTRTSDKSDLAGQEIAGNRCSSGSGAIGDPCGVALAHVDSAINRRLGKRCRSDESSKRGSVDVYSVSVDEEENGEYTGESSVNGQESC
jgi:hypothetical protein